MSKTIRQKVFGLALAGLASACIPEFPAESPFDPETPEAQQQKAELFGQVISEVDITLTEVQLIVEGEGALGTPTIKASSAWNSRRANMS
jgi:hypothetical protein